MISRLSRRSLVIVIALLIRHAGASAAGDPTAPVRALNDGLIVVMHEGRATPFDARMTMFTPVAERAFDLPLILKNSVGARYATFTPAQRAELLGAFTRFTAASYVANFDQFAGERFEIGPDRRRVGEDEVVTTRILSPSGELTRIDYVVRSINGTYKIVDVLLDGAISRVAVQRSDFRALLASGDPAPLLASLLSKIADLAAAAKG